MTELFFLVSSAKSAAVLEPLARVCQRNGTSWCCFFTGEGVQQLKSPNLVKLLHTAKRIAACEYSSGMSSWDQKRAQLNLAARPPIVN